MKKFFLLFIIFTLIQPSFAQADTHEDPFTIYIQGKLIDLGLLDSEPTGTNDKATQQAIKTFQEKAGLVVDGLVGVNTFSKLVLGESAYVSTSPTTTVSSTPTTTGPDTEPPVWDETQPPFASEISTLFTLNLPSVTDNVGVVSYEVYVNGALSTYVSISDTKLLVTPKYDTNCSLQYIYVKAFDEAGNSSQSPTFTMSKSNLCIDNTQNLFFSLNFGDTGTDAGTGIAFDSSGNIYISGYFEGTVDFGGGDVTANGYPSFIAKYNSAGIFQWVKTISGNNSVTAMDIKVDSSDNLYITGNFYGRVDFGDGVGVTSTGEADIFVLKLDESGTFQWVNTYPSGQGAIGVEIALDSSDNLYITGDFYVSIDFGNGAVTSNGSADMFVLKLNSAGKLQWVNTIGGIFFERGQSIAVDSSGNSYITGGFFGPVDFGGGEVDTVQNYDIFVLKLDSSGTFQWVNTIGGTGNDFTFGIAADPSGNSYITGNFNDTVDFGGGNVTSAGGSDIVVFKLNTAGTFQWVKTFGGTEFDSGYRIALDSSSYSYITGYFADTVDFGGGNVTSAGSIDIFVLKLDQSGSFQWVKTYGSTGADFGGHVTVDSSSNSYITGYFSDTVDFGNGAVTSVGNQDVFVLKLSPSGGLR